MLGIKPVSDRVVKRYCTDLVEDNILLLILAVPTGLGWHKGPFGTGLHTE